MGSSKAPRIVVTLAGAGGHAQPDLMRRRTNLYLDAIRRHGGEPIPVDTATSRADLDGALSTMDGLMLSGGGDLDPGRYGQPNLGSRDIDPARDDLEAMAWQHASARDVPVLGICRGLQAINVFSGGSLLQDVDGHAGAGWGTGPPATHPVRLVPGTRLAVLLNSDSIIEPLVVNAYHHQAVREGDLAPNLVAAAWADSSAGPLVEGLESQGARFVLGVQCHPERTESTPASFERVFAAFVIAAREGQPGPDLPIHRDERDAEFDDVAAMDAATSFWVSSPRPRRRHESRST
jgi:putative glutamine amidotransferase